MTATTTPTEPTLHGEILSAARQIVESGRFTIHLEDDPWAGAGVKNPPLLTLLDCLVGASGSLANAIADNAWDDCLPVPAAGAARMAQEPTASPTPSPPLRLHRTPPAGACRQ